MYNQFVGMKIMRKTTFVISIMMVITTFTVIFPIPTTLAASPILESPSPAINSTGTYNQQLKIQARDPDNNPLTLLFRTNASGTWETLGTYNGGNKQYIQNTTNMEIKNKRYYWSVNVTDLTSWTNRTYNFIAQPFVSKWKYYAHTNNNSIGPLAYDVNNDGIDEIFSTGQNWTTKQGKVFCVNGKTWCTYLELF